MKFSFQELKNLALKNKKYKDWYSRARFSLFRLAKAKRISYDKLAGVVAITSQNIHLEFNQVLVLEWISNGANYEAASKVRHYKAVQRNLQNFLKTGEIRGPKVSEFYKVLSHDDNAVVLDTHMKLPFKVKDWTVSNRLRAHRAINVLAKELNWTPAQVQAAIWCGVYKHKNPNKPIANYKFELFI